MKITPQQVKWIKSLGLHLRPMLLRPQNVLVGYKVYSPTIGFMGTRYFMQYIWLEK